MKSFKYLMISSTFKTYVTCATLTTHHFDNFWKNLMVNLMIFGKIKINVYNFYTWSSYLSHLYRSCNYCSDFRYESNCSDFRYESNGIFVLGVGFFSSDKFRLFT